MQPPFVIFGLPRSRTAWLAQFLSYKDWHCGHEQLMHMRGLDDVKAWLKQPNTGTAETAGSTWWRTLRKLSPEARIVIVKRPVHEVLNSMVATGVPFNVPELTRLLRSGQQKLNQIAKRVPGVLVVNFSDLTLESTCARIFEFCLPYPHDPSWWRKMAQKNIQINLQAMMRYCQANKTQLDRMNAQFKAMTLADMTLRPFKDPDDLQFREESIEVVLRDAKALMRDHCTVVGESPEEVANKNWEIMEYLEKGNSHQVITARCNGRIFGYLMTLIYPPLDDPNKRTACHTLFYASPGFPGMGRKLLLAAQEALTQKGVDDIIYRAGVRGDGPRLGALYKRMGAVPFGEIYRLEIKRG